MHIADPTRRLPELASLGGGLTLSNRFPGEAGAAGLRVKKLFWNNYQQLELLIFSKIKDVCFSAGANLF